MNLIIDHVPVSQKRRPGIKMTPTSITIHSTGNPNSFATGERKWLENPENDRTASWHYVVDESRIIEAIPPTEVAWHAGNDTGNKTSIGIELCETGDRAKVFANAKELVLHLMRKYNIEKVVRHFDWSGKICPAIMYDNGKWTTWSKFYWGIMGEYKLGAREITATLNGKIVKAVIKEGNSYLHESVLATLNVTGEGTPSIEYQGQRYLQWNRIPGMKDAKQRPDGGFDFIAVAQPKQEKKEEPKMEDYKGHWAEKEIDKVVAAGLMIGDDKGNFSPDKPLTRAELAVVLARFLNKMEGK